MTRRDALLYAVAGFLLLASVPIYRAILRGPVASDSPPVEAQRIPPRVVRPLAVAPAETECVRGILYRQDSTGAEAVVQGGQLTTV